MAADLEVFLRRAFRVVAAAYSARQAQNRDRWSGVDCGRGAVAARPAQAAGEASTCPRCGSALVERRKRRTGERVLGCSRYPSCRYRSAF